jgi:hypothetical protein
VCTDGEIEALKRRLEAMEVANKVAAQMVDRSDRLTACQKNMNAADAEHLQVAEEKLLDMNAEKTKAKKKLKAVKQVNERIKDLKRKRVGVPCGKLKDWEASSVVAAALGVEKEAAMGM